MCLYGHCVQSTVTVFLNFDIRGAQMHCGNAACSYMYQCNYASRMSPALNGHSEIQHFEHCNAIGIHDGKISDLYTGHVTVVD